MMEIMYDHNKVNERLNRIKKKDLVKGKSIETIFGKELIIKKELEKVSINNEIKLSTIMPANIGNQEGIIESQYNLLGKENGNWNSGHILMHVYFPEDEKYSELNKMKETNRE